jgi:hypothetical protein
MMPVHAGFAPARHAAALEDRESAPHVDHAGGIAPPVAVKGSCAMSSKSRWFVCGLAVAALGAVTLGYAAPQLTRSVLPRAERAALAPAAAAPKDAVRVNAPGTHVETGRDVRVQAPDADADVDKERGKVRVTAPHTDVSVDPDKGQVRVRAPYVNLDIRW